MRRKPSTIGCRLTEEKKERFYNRCMELGKRPQEVLEKAIDFFLGEV
jgi:hypothetical protein